MEMELSEFVFRLILVFIPGLISFIVVKQLTAHKKFEFYEESIYAFILGWISYLTYYLGLKIFNFAFPKESHSFDFLNELTDGKQPLNFHEIFLVSLISIIVGFLFTLAINQSWLHWFAQKIRFSKKFGDLSVFDLVMNSSITPWVVIRDLKNDHMYQGYIAAFPDSTEENGIFLRDVTIYVNSTGVKLYKTPGLFIERDRKDLIYDFPLVDSPKEPEKKGESKHGKRDGKNITQRRGHHQASRRLDKKRRN